MTKANIPIPVTELVSVTKSDVTEYSPPLRGIYVGGTGDLAVVLRDDSSAVTLVSLAAGVWHPLLVSKVMSTNTTATNIVGGR